MKKSIQRLIARILVVILAVTTLTTGIWPLGTVVNAAGIPVTGIVLDTDSWYAASDYFSDSAPTSEVPTKQLNAAVLPVGASNPAVVWSSSDSSVATVDQTGLVTAVSKGTAVITAVTEDGGYTASSKVYVPVISESFENRTIGNMWPVTGTATGCGAGLSTTAVASVSGSKVYSLAGSGSGARGTKRTFNTPVSGNKIVLDFDWNVGTTASSNGGNLQIEDSNNNRYITLQYKSGSEILYGTGGVTSSSNVSNVISATTVGTGFNVNNTTYNVHIAIDFVNKVMDLTVTNKSNPAKTSTITNIPFDSSTAYTSDVAKIEFVMTRASGTATWNSAYIDNFNVYSATPSVASVTLNKTSLSLINVTGTPNSEAQLKAVINPNVGELDRSVTWSSGDTGVAAVDSTGKVTAAGIGTAVITAASVADPSKKATCTVEVHSPIILEGLNIQNSGINVDGTTVNANTGDILKLTGAVTPANADCKSYTWSSGDENIISVNPVTGEVFAIAPGTSTVTLSAESYTADGAAADITAKTVTIQVAGTAVVNLMNLKKAIDNAFAVKIYSDSDYSAGSLAAYNSALAAARTDYAAATAPQSQIDSDTQALDMAVINLVNSLNIPIYKLAISPVTLTLAPHVTGTIVPVISPEFATDKTLIWSTGNPEVATVAGGVVTGVGAGTTVITARNSDGTRAATCNVTVTVPVDGITLDHMTLNLSVGGSKAVLIPTISPDNANNMGISWSTSDPAVAAVLNGVVTPVGAGTATITVTTADGSKTAECAVTVTPNVPVAGITLDRSTITLPKGGVTGRLIPAFSPAEASNTEITWSTSNASVAAVLDGVVTSEGPGTATITATTADGNHTASCTVTVAQTNTTITNDIFYKDTDGNPIYSQGGGIFKFGDTYYWYGVHYIEAETYAANPAAGKLSTDIFAGFSCYSSTDLVNWKNEGDVMTDVDVPASMDGKALSWIGRMGVAFNRNTQKYVLVSQIVFGGGAVNKLFYATGDSPSGKFVFDHVDMNPPFVNNGTGDQTIFQDDDGKAYLICSSASGRANIYVAPLDDRDFLSIKLTPENTTPDGKLKPVYSGAGMEGNCMFKYNGNYYIASSDLYGWNSSNCYVIQASNILGPYSPRYNLEGTQQNYCHNSQTGFFVTVNGTAGTTVIFAGDRWSDFAANGIGYNEWMPLSFNGTTPYFNNLSQWSLNAEAGTWSVSPGNNYLNNPDFEADRIVVKTPVGWTVSDNAGGAANTNVSGRQSTGSFYWKQGASSQYKAEMKQTVTGLPNGTYTLKAWVQSSGGQNTCNIYAKNSDGTENIYSLKETAISAWTQIVVSDNIQVTGGQCEIGVYSDGPAGKYVYLDNLTFTKNAVSVQGMVLSPESLTLEEGGAAGVLTPVITPSDAAGNDEIWSSSNPAVATVANGVVIPVGQGTAAITAVNPDGNRTAASSITVLPNTTAPGDVTYVLATAGDGTITLTWTDPADRDLSKIKIADIDTGSVYYADKWTGITTLTGLSNGDTYNLKISAVDIAGNESPGVMVNTAPNGPDTVAPDEVGGVSVIPGNGRLTVKWTDPANGDFDHVVVTVSGAAIDVQNVNKGIRQTTITGLENGVSYDISLRTVDTSGNESQGITVSGTPSDAVIPDDTAPGEVTGALVIPGSGRLTVVWTDPPDEDFDHVIVTATGAAITVQNIAKDIRQAEITGLGNGISYEISLKTVDTSGNESAGISVSGTPVAPSAPTSPTSPVTPEPEKVKVVEDTIKIIEIPKTDSKTGIAAAAPISEEYFKKALENAHADGQGNRLVLVEIPKAQEAKGYSVQLPKLALASGDPGVKVEIITDIGTIVVSANMFGIPDVADAKNIVLKIAAADISDMDASYGEEAGSRPAVNLEVLIDDKAVEWSNQNAPVTVTIPYDPTEEEFERYEHITVWYVDDNGGVTPVPSGKYHPETGMVTFTATHFSKYTVVFVNKTFSDVPEKFWGRTPIEVLASKGIAEGTSDMLFSPDSKITRGEFIMWLVKTLGLSADYSDSFSDVESTDVYYNEIAIAKTLGITAGTGNNKFSPEADISRQDMMVLTIKAMKAAGIKLEGGSQGELAKFTDSSSIAGYALQDVIAMVRTGLVVGSGNKINPVSNITRAEVAQILYKIYIRP